MVGIKDSDRRMKLTSSNAVGLLLTYASHACFPPLKRLPAQSPAGGSQSERFIYQLCMHSPHKVKLIMKLLSENACKDLSSECSPTSHSTSLTLLKSQLSPLSKIAVGVPQLAGFGLRLPFLMSTGTSVAAREKNHTLIVLLVRSVAHQPPPAALNAGP